MFSKQNKKIPPKGLGCLPTQTKKQKNKEIEPSRENPRSTQFIFSPFLRGKKKGKTPQKKG